MLGTNTSPAILVPRRNYLLEASVLLIPRPMCFPLDATENRFDHSHGRSVRLCVIRSAPSHMTIQKSSATGGATTILGVRIIMTNNTRTELIGNRYF